MANREGNAETLTIKRRGLESIRKWLRLREYRKV